MGAADLIGQRFGKVTVIEKVGRSKHKTILWRCLCDCGNMTTAQTSDLRMGKVKSCGCNIFKDRQTLGGKPTRIYRIWKNMKKRCYNQNNKDFKYYGARGIKVCDPWRNNFGEFHRWAIKNGYNDNLSLDRIDNDGNYEPENCRWTTMKEQAKHRRPCGSVMRNGQVVA